MNISWIHEQLVAETVTWFVGRAVPDPGSDWQEGAYEILDAVPDVPRGRAYRVCYDIPTAEPSLGVWLSFVIDVRPGDGDPIVRDIHAVRGGRGENDCETYEWMDDEGCWALVADEDGELA